MRKIVTTPSKSAWVPALLAAALSLASLGAAQADPLANYDRNVGRSVGAAPRSIGLAYRDQEAAGLRADALPSSGCKHTFIERRYNLC